MGLNVSDRTQLMTILSAAQVVEQSIDFNSEQDRRFRKHRALEQQNQTG
jgi:hypothetical protein